MKRLDISGKKFGKLTVIKYSHSYIQPSKQKRAMWECLCDCGNIKVVSTSNLTGKRPSRTISCGCFIKERLVNGINKKNHGEANFNYRYLSYKHRAKNINKPFELSKDEFKLIVNQKCYYCNAEGKSHYTRRSENGTYLSNGIDRVDSNLGYTTENCVPCCKTCNMMKSNLTQSDFFQHIFNINVHLKSKGLC